MLTLKVIINFLAKALLNDRGNAGFMGDEGAGGDDSGAGEEGSSGAAGAAGGSEISYPDGFEDSLKGNESLLKFVKEGKFDHANIMKSYVHMEKMLGNDKIPVPNEHTTDEQMQQIFDKLGRPARDGYKIESTIPEGIEPNEEFNKNYTDLAHKTGLLPKQAKEILDFFYKSVGDDYANTQAKYESSLNETKSLLQGKWGDAYENNVKIANHALKEFATDEQMAQMTEMGLMKNPHMIELFNKVGMALSEDKTIDQINANGAMTPDQIRDKISAMYNDSHPFMNSSHPDHEFAKKKMLEMQELLAKY